MVVRSVVCFRAVSGRSWSRRFAAVVSIYTRPTLGERRGAERVVLDLCDGMRSMGEIAEVVRARFPKRFKSASEALAFAGDVLK